jgi:hypothetical protein
MATEKLERKPRQMRKIDYTLVGVIVAIISLVITLVAYPPASDWFSGNAAVDDIYISCAKVSDSSISALSNLEWITRRPAR